MAITAAQVNDLRQRTGAGMMDCKRALEEANGDVQKAIEILRKKGASVAAKRAEKSANEGLIVTKISDDKKSGTILEINCETDFVAKSEDFINLADFVINTVHKNKPKNVEELLTKNSDVQNKLNDVLGKVGEKIEISRFDILETNDGMLVDYIHMGSKLGVLIKFDDVKDGGDELSVIGKDMAMQVAAMNPISIAREDVSKNVVDKELEIYKELAKKEGKPEQILEKIAMGRLNKFYQENVLLEQAFIKDNSKTVGDLLKEFNSKHGSKARVTKFDRFHLGDEKK
ncbi:MAG: translation elongation factor Ts [Ignavibacteriaceae bacterium]|jgi:elongation factor Ts|nr:translation elongation factor Ts [Ignavibacteriaceae bacterium]MCW8812873.1 translation elongation factor Ts [Chlorobium sp.]MCW8817463.1 translation elongation factor Ts [Ignavibacteriaceae bacterium]MCW8961264.1 translation elongation factor Ts [Ignavibacteriaceae bacterium]MCW9094317.1 translation elongation factor Ts [Ignavibacteriaceae bacterium]